MYRLFLILFVLSNFGNLTFALRCYTCSVGESDLDQRCVTDPASVEIGTPITNCNKKYCTSIRQEYLDPKGKVASMLRFCEDKPAYLNEVIEDVTFRYYYSACQEELCNDGTGYDTSGGGGIIGQDTEGVIYTLGIAAVRSTATAMQPLLNACMFTIMFATSILLR